MADTPVTLVRRANDDGTFSLVAIAPDASEMVCVRGHATKSNGEKVEKWSPDGKLTLATDAEVAEVAEVAEDKL